MRLREVLDLPCLRGAAVVAGRAGLGREVCWVHVIDNPDTVTWARPGQLLLTTGYAWPRADAELRSLFGELAATGVTAVGLAVPQFFERFPAALGDVAEANAMALVEIPWEVPFAQITEEVHTALLGEHARVIERSEAIHRALTRTAATATNLEGVVRTLAAETALRVAFVTDDAQVIAYAGREGERLSEGDAAALAAASREASAGSAEALAEVARFDPPVAEADWVVCCPVQVQGARAGSVWLLGRGAGPGALERRAAEHGALVAALHLSHQRELATVETRLRRSFVEDLLEGRVDGSDYASERGHVVGFSDRARYRIALAELDLATPLSLEDFARREAALARVRAMLARHSAADLVTTTSNRVVAVLPEALEPERLWDTLGAERRAMAISRAHQGVAGVRLGFEEASASIRHVPRGSFASFESLLLPRAISGDEAAQRALVMDLEQPLAAQRGGSKLVATLVELARRDFVLTETATALGVHISTLRHRLERIEDVLALDLRDPDVRFRVRIAAYVRDLVVPDPT